MSYLPSLKTNSSALKTIGTAALTGAAVNIGIQVMRKNLRKDNFLSIFAIGALSGTVIASIVRGVSGSAKACTPSTYETKKWKIRSVYQLPNGNLPFYHQKDPSVGCTQETLKSICDYLNHPIAFLDYPVDIDLKNKKVKNVNHYKDGADFELLAKANGLTVNTVEYYNTKRGKVYNPDIVGSYLMKNNPLAITYERSGDLPHTVGINRIVRLMNVSNPKANDRYIIEVMDPLFVNTYQQLPMDVLNSGTIRFVKPPYYYA